MTFINTFTITFSAVFASILNPGMAPVIVVAAGMVLFNIATAME